MTVTETSDLLPDRQRRVLEHQRDALRSLVHRVTELRRTVPGETGEWRSPASRRYEARLRHLDDTLESAARELAGGASAASVALAHLGSLR